jgi:hypothetical protein
VFESCCAAEPTSFSKKLSEKLFDPARTELKTGMQQSIGASACGIRRDKLGARRACRDALHTTFQTASHTTVALCTGTAFESRACRGAKALGLPREGRRRGLDAPA